MDEVMLPDDETDTDDSVVIDGDSEADVLSVDFLLGDTDDDSDCSTLDDGDTEATGDCDCSGLEDGDCDHIELTDTEGDDDTENEAEDDSETVRDTDTDTDDDADTETELDTDWLKLKLVVPDEEAVLLSLFREDLVGIDECELVSVALTDGLLDELEEPERDAKGVPEVEKDELPETDTLELIEGDEVMLKLAVDVPDNLLEKVEEPLSLDEAEKD